MSKLILELLQIGAISKCQTVKGEYLSPIFLVPKPDGSKRFILNLKKLNSYVKVKKFKMEDLRTAQKLMMPDCYMCTIDIKDAYFHMPLNKTQRKYFRFLWNGKKYEFMCYPFGLSTAPRTFTKLMKPVISFLRNQGFTSVIYLDDILCIGYSYAECLKNVKSTVSLLESLGFKINRKKSCLEPSTSVRFLGFILDSKSMKISLPSEKCDRAAKIINFIRQRKIVSALKMAELTGTIISCAPAIPYAMLYTKNFESQKTKSMLSDRLNFSLPVRINKIILSDLQWWAKALENPSQAIRHDVFPVVIYTDASTTGWGAVCNECSIGGLWDEKQKKMHINFLELLAVYFAVLSFASKTRNIQILLRIDNMTAICCVNRMGSTKFAHLNSLSRDIWQFCEKRNIWIFASYIKSKSNIHADYASRIVSTETEWSLSDQAFEKICAALGSPCIDLFASCNNYKLPIYISWKPDPFCQAIDAFTLDWSVSFFYAFPPFNLISRTIKKICSDRAIGILVVPNWSSQPWFPLFHKLKKSKIVHLTPSNDLLMFGTRTHPLCQSLSLMAAVLSGKLTN